MIETSPCQGQGSCPGWMDVWWAWGSWMNTMVLLLAVTSKGHYIIPLLLSVASESTPQLPIPAAVCLWNGSSLLLFNTVSLQGCWPRGSATSWTSFPISSKPQIVSQPCWSSSYIFMVPGHYYHRAFALATPCTVSGRLCFLGLNMTDSF